MLDTQFLEAYPRTLPDWRINATIGDVDMSGSRGWSEAMGGMLHDVINGDISSRRKFDRTVLGYLEWFVKNLPGLHNGAEALPDPEDTGRIHNEVNFHHLNFAMLEIWGMAREGERPTSPTKRRAIISAAQDDIAFQGIHLYAQRQKHATRGDYSYFDEDNDTRRGVTEGIANEFDAGIVLLELMKRYEDLYVLPAPIQFEAFSIPETRSTHYNNNVDYVILKGDQAIGAQIKTLVQQRDVDTYNPDRVMLVDARADFGNERHIRTQQESTRQRSVAWGALLCAQRFARMPSHGDKHSFMRLQPQRAAKMKFIARQLVGGMNLSLDSAATIVGDRLMASLEAA